MTREEIRAKSLQLAELYTAKGSGKTLQIKCDTGWESRFEDTGPDMHSDLSLWRVKPEPRTFWVLLHENGDVIDVTQRQARADGWRKGGQTVAETMEVLP